MIFTADSPNQIGHQLEVNQGTGDVPPNPNKISTPMNDHVNELLNNANVGNWTVPQPVTVEQLKAQLEAVTAERDKYKAEVDTLNHKIDYLESESDKYVVRLFKQGERIEELEQDNAKLKARQDQIGEMLAEVLNLLAKKE